MNSLIKKTTSNFVPFLVASVVAASSSIIGFGIYHGEFHTNGSSTHCHNNGVCHNH